MRHRLPLRRALDLDEAERVDAIARFSPGVDTFGRSRGLVAISCATSGNDRFLFLVDVLLRELSGAGDLNRRRPLVMRD